MPGMSEPRLSEQLGFGRNETVAIVHVDDLGMCHAANEGGFAALRNGPATCGSIMVPCPWFREAADIAAREPRFDLGVHLTLNAEWEHYRWGPVAGRSEVPSLVDEQGYLPRTTLEVLQQGKPEEVEIELRAQVQMALDAGIDVTHLDTHMGTCFLPPFLPIYAKLAREFDVPVFAVGTADDAELKRRGLLGLKEVLAPLVEGLARDGFPIMDGFCAESLDFKKGKGEKHNGRRLDGLVSGVNYLICHAAQGGEELQTVTPDSDHQRDFERTYYGGDSGRKALDSRGIRTVGMRELRSLLPGR